jgi:hypothetical protein
MNILTLRRSLAAGAAVLAAALVPAAALGDGRPIPAPAIPGAPGLPGPVAPDAKAPADVSQLRLLKATPDTGFAGTAFTLSGTGLPADKDLQVVWSTANGVYVLNPAVDTVDWWGRQMTPVNVVLANAHTDGSGSFSIQLRAPHDYGEIHDLYAVIDGNQVAKGGFRIARHVTVTPLSGPIGTPITISIDGLGWRPYEGTAAILYDNKYAGFMTSVTTRGQTVATIRASGPVGLHPIEVAPSSAAVPYLDVEQSALAFVGKYRTAFRVTKDAGPPKQSIEYPAAYAPTVADRTTLSSKPADGVSGSLDSTYGPILTKVGVAVKGLAASKPVSLQWVTAIGTRARASGWDLQPIPVGKAATGGDGTLATSFRVPDDLGGWHVLQVAQDGQVKVELPYYVMESVVGVRPLRVKEGHVFTLHVKGTGWTELDNGFAVVYDNSYVGYGCGFFSRGDVNMNMVATGGPGTHLIDLYPMIYKQKGSDIWQGNVPFLSWRYDEPALALGYRLPAVHLAIQVVK